MGILPSPKPVLRLLGGVLAIFLFASVGESASKDLSLHQRIDALIEAAAKEGQQPAELTNDYEFVRRVYLDFAGRIPTAAEVTAFVNAEDTEKRSKLIDELLASETYPQWMQVRFTSLLMERRGSDERWEKYLQDAFAANKPWDQMVREMLSPDWSADAVPGASFFVTKRLEKYGQQATDYPGLTRDVGRLMLGVDLKCAQCHDHLTIDDYKQQDFQGLFIVFNNTFLQSGKSPPELGENLLTEPIEFTSVFIGTPEQTGPKVPGREEIPLPEVSEDNLDAAYLEPPDKKKRTPGIPKFSGLTAVAAEITAKENRAFARNMANRLWFLLLGRGLVEPLDQHHSDNPASHPELLELLSQEFVAHDMDIQYLLREIALSNTYQRSSRWAEASNPGKPAPRTFLIGIEKRLLAEQLQTNVLQATGPIEPERDTAMREKLEPVFIKAFAGPEKEPELEFAPSLQSALMLMNDDSVQQLLQPLSGNGISNLVQRLTNAAEDAAAIEELYLSVLSRQPSESEMQAAKTYLEKNSERRSAAFGNLVWSLMASTEFCTNH